MKLAVVTWTLGLSEPQAVLAKALALGLDGIQYSGDHRDACPVDLREQSRRAGITILAVDPINAGPQHSADATQDLAVDYYRKVIDFAAELGNVPVTLQGLSLWTRNCPDAASAHAQLLACCKVIDAYAQRRGVPTLYEPCNHFELPLINTAQQCRELIHAVGSDNLRMVLDSFHMNINEPDPVQTLRDCAHLTAIYHISDSGRGAIGTGHIDFAAQYQALVANGFSGDVSIELVLPHLLPGQPPGSQSDCQALDVQIRASARQWRAYQPAAAQAVTAGG